MGFEGADGIAYPVAAFPHRFSRDRSQDRPIMTDTTTSQADLGEQLLGLAASGQERELEDLWLSNIQQLPEKSGFYKNWLKVMRHHRLLERTEQLVALALEEYIGGEQYKRAMRVLVPALNIFVRSEMLRPLVLHTLEGFYATTPHIERLTERSGLKDPDKSLPEGFNDLQEWLKLAPGQAYQHLDWGVGLIRQLDLENERVIIDFPGQAGKQMTWGGIRNHLTYLKSDHILAMRAKKPELLGRQAKEDPTGLVKRALRSQPERALQQAELKALLTPDIIEAKQWNRWWTAARNALKNDPFIDLDPRGGARARIRLRATPRMLGQEIEETFFDPGADAGTKARLIQEALHRPPEARPSGELAARMTENLARLWQQTGNGDVAARIEIALMMQDLAQLSSAAEHEGSELDMAIAGVETYSPLLHVQPPEYAVRALDLLVNRDAEQGPRKAAALMPLAEPKLAQAIWSILREQDHPELVIDAVHELIADPIANPETATWALRMAVDGSWPALRQEFPPIFVVRQIVRGLDAWHDLQSDPTASQQEKSAAHTLIRRMRTLLGAGDCALLTQAVETMPRAEVIRLRRTLEHHEALPAALRHKVERAIRLARRDLDEPAPMREPAEDGLHDCTGRAYMEKAEELRILTSEKIPQNSKAIKVARAEGDLRENAGYQYAKEEQSMLLQQQATLQDQLSRARIVRPHEVDQASVGFGTHVRLCDLDDQQQHALTILGRWEADPEHHVISQHAPLAQQLKGHGVGDEVTVELPNGQQKRYRILGIENALASGQWEEHGGRTTPGLAS